MPKVIKKKPAKKKPAREEEVKSAARQALDTIRERRKHVIIGVSAIAVVIVLLLVLSLYSTSRYKKAYALEQEGTRYYYADSLNESLGEEERLKKAVQFYEQSVSAKASPSALFYLGNAYYKLGDYTNAINAFERFIGTFSGADTIIPLVYQKLAAAYFATAQNEKALQSLNALSSFNKGIFRDTALVLEARHYESAGEQDKAMETYRKIIAEYPSSPWTVEANARVSADENKAKTTQSQKPAPAEAPAAKKTAPNKKANEPAKK